MATWTTGYSEFWEDRIVDFSSHQVTLPKAPEYICSSCEEVCLTEIDLLNHRNYWHASPQPQLSFRGKICGSSRLNISKTSSDEDWRFSDTETIKVNDEVTTQGAAKKRLSTAENEVINLTLMKGPSTREYSISFSIASDSDLNNVDSAFKDFINTSTLSQRTINDFIERTRRFTTAKKYVEALVHYLYGLQLRENHDDLVAEGNHRISSNFGTNTYSDDERFAMALEGLREFDRPLAELLKGIMFFQINHFPECKYLVMNNQISALADSILKAFINPGSLFNHPIWPAEHDDVSTPAVLHTCEIIGAFLTFDSVERARKIQDLVDNLGYFNPNDRFKIHFLSAEHFYSIGDGAQSIAHAKQIQNLNLTEEWYEKFVKLASEQI